MAADSSTPGKDFADVLPKVKTEIDLRAAAKLFAEGRFDGLLPTKPGAIPTKVKRLGVPVKKEKYFNAPKSSADVAAAKQRKGKPRAESRIAPVDEGVSAAPSGGAVESLSGTVEESAAEGLGVEALGGPAPVRTALECRHFER
jgi:hypothetical protein